MVGRRLTVGVMVVVLAGEGVIWTLVGVSVRGGVVVALTGVGLTTLPQYCCWSWVITAQGTELADGEGNIVTGLAGVGIIVGRETGVGKLVEMGRHVPF